MQLHECICRISLLRSLSSKLDPTTSIALGQLVIHLQIVHTPRIFEALNIIGRQQTGLPLFWSIPPQNESSLSSRRHAIVSRSTASPTCKLRCGTAWSGRGRRRRGPGRRTRSTTTGSGGRRAGPQLSRQRRQRRRRRRLSPSRTGRARARRPTDAACWAGSTSSLVSVASLGQAHHARSRRLLLTCGPPMIEEPLPLCAIRIRSRTLRRGEAARDWSASGAPWQRSVGSAPSSTELPSLRDSRGHIESHENRSH